MNLQRASERWKTIAVGLVTTILAVVAVLILIEMSTRHLLLPTALVVTVLALAGYFAAREPVERAPSHRS